jgi:hypothetical protein
LTPEQRRKLYRDACRYLGLPPSELDALPPDIQQVIEEVMR